jgi:hypothetical protein
MMRRITPTVLLRTRILGVYCDALIAWSHGEPINTPVVQGEIDALIDAAFAEQAKQREARRRRQIAASFRRRR